MENLNCFLELLKLSTVAMDLYLILDHQSIDQKNIDLVVVPHLKMFHIICVVSLSALVNVMLMDYAE